MITLRIRIEGQYTSKMVVHSKGGFIKTTVLKGMQVDREFHNSLPVLLKRFNKQITKQITIYRNTLGNSNKEVEVK